MATIDFSIEGFKFCQNCNTFVIIENFYFKTDQCQSCEFDDTLEDEEADEEDPYKKDLEDLEEFG